MKPRQPQQSQHRSHTHSNNYSSHIDSHSHKTGHAYASSAVLHRIWVTCRTWCRACKAAMLTKHLWHQFRIANDVVCLPCVPGRDCGHFYRAPLALSVGECRVQFGCFQRNILRRTLARLSNKAPHLLCLPIQVACGGFVDPINSRTRSD